MPRENHQTEIRLDRAPSIQYRVYCKSCGWVGQAQNHEEDAKAIAQRHAEVGGYEGRS